MAHKRDCATKAGCQYWPRYVTTLVQTLYARGMAHKRDCAVKAGCQYWPRYVTTLVQRLYARGMAHKRDCAAKAGCQYWPRYVVLESQYHIPTYTGPHSAVGSESDCEFDPVLVPYFLGD